MSSLFCVLQLIGSRDTGTCTVVQKLYYVRGNWGGGGGGAKLVNKYKRKIGSLETLAKW